MKNVRLRGWIEAFLAAVSGILFVLTLAWPDWIEGIFEVDPDQHSGALEWVVVAVLLCATAVFSLLARSEWRRAATARAE
ncbi:ABC transporter permease [Streptomyces sp. NPDC057011]|uniref:ABC transporter permease n=1 Tax=unclassified Streptomyces TaxID=2593676 RepID=UPI003632B45E